MSESEHIAPDEPAKPHTGKAAKSKVNKGNGHGEPQEPIDEAFTPEELDALDEDERELRALREDLPGSKGASAAGIVTISVGKKVPNREFFRTHPTIQPEIRLADHAQGLDVEYHAVSPEMVPALAAIAVHVNLYRLYFIRTLDGTSLFVPVCRSGPGAENEWNMTKMLALEHGRKEWVRLVSDTANKRFKVFPAPQSAYPEPQWLDLSEAKLFRLAFRERGRLIDSVNHPLYRKWAGLP